MEKTKKLNLGCGKDIKPKKEGWVNLDFIKSKGVDVVWDLNKYPYPFKDSEFYGINAKDIFEHLDNPNMFIQEMHRITKNKGEIHIRTPHFASAATWGDLTHKRGFSILSLNHYDEKKREGKSLNNKERILFSIEKKAHLPKPYKLLGIQKIANKFPDFFERYLCYTFQPGFLTFVLKPIKK
jgi:SAM-dependent methyltransferase